MSAEGSITNPDAGQAALLRVVRGVPTPEELAALITVVSASAVGRSAPETAMGERSASSAWADRSSLMRSWPERIGPGAWRWSAFPR